MGRYLGYQFAFGHITCDAFLDLATFEEQKSGDAQHTILCQDVGILVGIDLDHFDFASHSPASCLTMGSIILQGPHQIALKSTSTGSGESSTSVWNVASVTLIGSAIYTSR